MRGVPTSLVFIIAVLTSGAAPASGNRRRGSSARGFPTYGQVPADQIAGAEAAVIDADSAKAPGPIY